MLTNIEYGGRTIPRRPRQVDKEVLSDVFDAILLELSAEAGWDMEDQSENEAAKRAFIDAAQYDEDGYQIMRNLESHGWEGNSTLVEIFNDAPFSACCAKHVSTWLTYFRVEPVFDIGDVVTFKHGFEKLTGVIEKIMGADDKLLPGYYGIHVEGRDGRPCVPWEYATKEEPKAG